MGRYLVGVDENGLGPRLGPLVVTAVMARSDDERAERVAAGRPGRAFSRLGDSKDLVAHGDTSLGEAWARSLAARLGLPSASPADLLHGLSIDPAVELRSRCPDEHVDQCWGAVGEAFTADEKLVAKTSRDLDRLAERGVHVTSIQVALVCTERLNHAVAAGRSRFAVDLHTMERLVLAARERAGEDVVAVCGKVGGYDRYSSAFGPLAGWLHAVEQEGRARSEYRFPGVGRIAFVRDADARCLLVGMASLVGKWVRDLATDRVVRYHRAHDESLPAGVSGYHDPVTARFVAASALSRAKRGVPDECFERRALAKEEPNAPRAT